MTASVTTQVRLSRSSTIATTTASQKMLYAPQRLKSLIAWVVLIGIFFPPIPFLLGGIHFTLGRFVVILLLIPALAILLKRGRNGAATDLFAIAFTTWMLGSSALNGGFAPYVGAEALEFLGAYLVGRAFFFGPSNLWTFIRVFRRITIVLIALALLDTLTGQLVTLNSFGIETYTALKRGGFVRAASVFEGAEHYGTFCVAAAAILFYSERGMRRIAYVGLCFFGCALSLSSGPLQGLTIVTATICYDRLLKQYSQRWKALSIVLVGIILASFLIFDHPIPWIVAHFTFDPQTAWWRIGTWNFASPLIDQSPYIGYGLVKLGVSADAQLFLASVDSMWLLLALRFGLPGAFLLILTILSLFLRRRRSTFDPSMYNVQTGFSLAIIVVSLIGITVHFWDAPWLFLSLCVGIRASLAEYGARHQASPLPSNDLPLRNSALPRTG